MELVGWERRVNSELSAIQRAGCASVTYKDRFALILGGRFHDTFYLDCWTYDTTSGATNEISGGPKNCNPRAYHTATLIDGVVWIIGGSDDDAIHSDDPVWCFDVKTRVWTQPKLQGNLTLLHRTAHGACLHPTVPGCILLFGGYGTIQLQHKTTDFSSEPKWLSDLVLVNTRTNKVESVNYRGRGPIPRAYHSFSAIGTLCVAIFGRTENKSLVSSKKSVAVYDAQSGTWLEISEKDIKGVIPQVRSSHRACSVVVSGNSGGVLIFGGAPALASKKIDRLADMHYLKIIASPPQAGSRRVGSSSGSKYHFEWINCGDGAEMSKGSDTIWPIGRGAHAQEFINGKLCLFGGYCRHEKYCTDVWEGLVVVEGQQLATAAAAAAGAGARTASTPVAVCNNTSAAGVEASPKWKSTRGRIETADLLQNILPSDAKRQKKGGGGGDVAKNSKLLPPVAAAAAGKRMKNHLVENLVAINPPSTISPEMKLRSLQKTGIEKEVKVLQEALVLQRAKEAALLREANAAKSDVFKLKEELQKADENWRKTAAERDDWKMKFNDQQRVASKAISEKTAAFNEATAAEERCQEATRRLKASSTIADQKQKALDAAAAQNAQLQSNATALQGALDQATAVTDKERQLRISIQEQNTVLQVKMTTAEAERNEFQRQLQLLRSSLENAKMQFEAEQSRLEQELTTAKTSLSAVQREVEATKRQKSKLESEIESLQDEKNAVQSKVQRLESDVRSVQAAKEREEADNKKLRDDMHRFQREIDDKQGTLDTELDVIHRALQRARDANAASGSWRQ
jgi:hypothetical protein